MEFEKVKNLIEIIENSKFVDFELEMKDSFYIKMSKSDHNTQNNPKTQAISLETAYDNIQTNKEDITQIAKTISDPVTIMPEDDNEPKGGNLVTSPIVGTFYAASSPDKPPYVKVGDKVKQGDILCVVEAMKVMNEITSKFDGEVAEILVKNEDMVEYNQPLFRII